MNDALTYHVRWAEMDPNGHMRHSAYADFATDQRVAYLRAHGFDLQKFGELRLGPVTFREETKFLKEVHVGEAIRVDGRLLSLRMTAAAGPCCTPFIKPTVGSRPPLPWRGAGLIWTNASCAYPRPSWPLSCAQWWAAGKQPASKRPGCCLNYRGEMLLADACRRT